MRKFFWIGFFGLLLFEVINVYLIMPMPGSQRMNSIDAAYFFYRWRWAFRIVLGLLLLIGLLGKGRRKWLLLIPLLILFGVIYMANFKMAADHMFSKTKELSMVGASANKVDSQRLVIGVFNNGQAKAYPIRFLGFHHQVQDSVGGEAVLVTYCTVCRTGRVYSPVVNGHPETFRLVGMDHFNAMFEDNTTKSWWRQETGEAIAGKLKGTQLPEIYSTQTSLAQWLRLYPNSLIMQADSNFISSYGSDTAYKYENGLSRASLTGTDSLSWKDKSWVIGVKAGDQRKAYDWNQLKKQRVIEDKLGDIPLVVVLSNDDKSFFAFQKPGDRSSFVLRNDTIIVDQHHYQINGKGIDTAGGLKPLPAYQEFWHSWRSFNPTTLR